MSNTARVIAVVIGLILLLVVSLLVTRVGGIAIRGDGSALPSATLTVSEPLIRGVPVVVRWPLELASDTALGVDIQWREQGGEYMVGTGVLAAAQAQIVVPCVGTAATGSLVLRRTETYEVLAHTVVAVLPPGPECASAATP